MRCSVRGKCYGEAPDAHEKEKHEKQGTEDGKIALGTEHAEEHEHNHEPKQEVICVDVILH